MQIFIKTLNGKTICLNVEQSETIENIKRKIEDKEGIPLQFQTLRYRKVLNNDKTLLFYNIKDESNLQLTSNFKSSMQIIIKSVQKNTTLFVKPDNTIKMIKDELKKLEEDNLFFSPRLIYRGKELEDDTTLLENNIKYGSIILLVDKEYYQYIYIFIKCLSGMESILYVKTNDTIRDIKRKIFKSFKIPIINQDLIFNGIHLSNYKSLSYYNIKKNCIVLLNSL